MQATNRRVQIMAKDTSKALRNLVIYQILVRNFSKEGTFLAIIPELDRIKALGADVIWLAPIHPTGEKNRKGSLGSPYAIKDYRATNPEYGTIEDFAALSDEIHRRGIKLMIDVVYNHTSPDSVLAKTHPEWFYHKADGSLGNHVGDWSDVVDLEYTNTELWDYQIETLCYWAKYVDGFRCDVASMVPVEFWQKARAQVEKVRPGCIWLAETVHPIFITEHRKRGINVLSDSEILQAFDISYDYDIFADFTDFVKGKAPLSHYAECVNRQEYTYPDNYIKLRFLENHDVPRARALFPDIKALKNATAFNYFQKGTTLIYAGEEAAVSHVPGLFDKDDVIWDSDETVDLSGLLYRLYEIKKNPVFTDSAYHLTAMPNDIILGVHESFGKKAVGIFSMRGNDGPVSVGLPDGTYENLIDQSPVKVTGGKIASKGDPIIIIS